MSTKLSRCVASDDDSVSVADHPAGSRDKASRATNVGQRLKKTVENVAAVQRDVPGRSTVSTVVVTVAIAGAAASAQHRRAPPSHAPWLTSAVHQPAPRINDSALHTLASLSASSSPSARRAVCARGRARSPFENAGGACSRLA